MTSFQFLILFIVLFTLDYFWQFILTTTNMRHLNKNKNRVPDFIEKFLSSESYIKTISYNMAKYRFNLVESFFSAAFILFMILSGVFGELEIWLGQFPLNGHFFSITYIFMIALIMNIFSLPFEIYHQFVLEEKYGFNKMKISLFFVDLLKGLLLNAVILFPLLFVLFFILDTAGVIWWLLGFGAFFVFQLLFMFLFPLFIAPLFNKFTPMEDSPLKEKIFALAEKLDFKTSGIFVMDGSRRSSHSNAYFTGIGRSKRIVLFDTLIKNLSEDELLAVLAHEIGHEKLHHTRTSLIFSVIISFVGFFILNQIWQYPPLFQAFGFHDTAYHSLVIILMLCSRPFTFFLTPLFSAFSRRHEYQADEFAVKGFGSKEALKGALIALSKDNLSNLTPHPLFSAVYYSHPSLGERLKAIEGLSSEND
ncbi:MAG: M48 family metallopeptidase [Spirochaetales bacterium]|nr:M48 family metallopeptidase [Spirochaetales bacterium]